MYNATVGTLTIFTVIATSATKGKLATLLKVYGITIEEAKEHKKVFEINNPFYKNNYDAKWEQAPIFLD